MRKQHMETIIILLLHPRMLSNLLNTITLVKNFVNNYKMVLNFLTYIVLFSTQMKENIPLFIKYIVIYSLYFLEAIYALSLSQAHNSIFLLMKSGGSGKKERSCMW